MFSCPNTFIDLLDFKVPKTTLKLYQLLAFPTFPDMAEDVGKRVWDYSPQFWLTPHPLHCESLAGACLTIRKDSA